MKRFLVVGLGLFGAELARTLHEKGAEVIGIDNDMEIIESMKDNLTSAVNVDCTNEEALRCLLQQHAGPVREAARPGLAGEPKKWRQALPVNQLIGQAAMDERRLGH